MKTRKSEHRFGVDSGLTVSPLELMVPRSLWEESDIQTEGVAPGFPNSRDGVF